MWLAFVAHVIFPLVLLCFYIIHYLSLDISLSRLRCKYLRTGPYLVLL